MNKFIKLGEQPFSDGYQPKGVMPYLHSMVFHFSFFIEKYHNVKQFSCQGWYSRTYSIMTIILCSEQVLKRKMTWLKSHILETVTSGIPPQTF